MTERPDLSVDLEIAEQAALCGDPPLWWQTRWYVQPSLKHLIWAQIGPEPAYSDRFVAQCASGQIADLIVAWHNETVAAAEETKA